MKIIAKALAFSMVLQTSLFGMFIAEIEVNGRRVGCLHCTQCEDSVHLGQDAFERILQDIVIRQTPNVQKEVNNETSSLDLGGLSIPDYIKNHHQLVYNRFREGKSQVLVCVNDQQKCLALVFFSKDNSFQVDDQNAIHIEQNVFLANADEVPISEIKNFFSPLHNIIAQEILPQCNCFTLALPKGSVLLKTYVEASSWQACDYTGSHIDLDKKIAFFKPIERLDKLSSNE